MKINFNLPTLSRVGGVRVIFEVANRLIERGHEVEITSFGKLNEEKWFPLKADVNYVEVPLFLKACNKIGLIDVHSNWEKYGLEDSMIKAIPDCDVNIATAANTAYPTYRSKKGKMFYYIQHYEPIFYSNIKAILKAKSTYQLPLRKLVVSKWLEQAVKKVSGQDATHISNGVNLSVFSPKNKKNYERKMIMSIFRNCNWKGDGDAILALNVLYKRMKEMNVCYIGSRKRFNEFTADMDVNFKINFVDSPDDSRLSELYDMSNVFLSPSWSEGFPLPPLEAMACGTPVVTTSNLGVREYAVNGYNSLVVPVRDIEKMANALFSILNDPVLADRLGTNGIETCASFRWKNVVDKLESAFMS